MRETLRAFTPSRTNLSPFAAIKTEREREREREGERERGRQREKESERERKDVHIKTHQYFALS